MAKREVEQWITINGVHVPVFKGESKADAAKNFKAKVGKRNAKQPITQKGKANAKKEYTNARNAATQAGRKVDEASKKGQDTAEFQDAFNKYDKATTRHQLAKQKYTEAKEKKVIKSAKVEKKGSEVSEEKLRSYGYDPHDSTGDPTVIQSDKGDFYKIGDNKWNEHSKSGKALGGTYTDKQIADKLKDAKQVKVLPSEKKQDTQVTKTSTDNVTAAKTHQDLTDKLNKNGLKLDAADAHTMENSNSLNGEKVTMYDKDGNEYRGTYNKYSDGGREIVNIKKTADSPRKIANDNEDLKEKQIARNKAEATARSIEASKAQGNSAVARKDDAIQHIMKTENVGREAAERVYNGMSQSEKDHTANEAYKANIQHQEKVEKYKRDLEHFNEKLQHPEKYSESDVRFMKMQTENIRKYLKENDAKGLAEYDSAKKSYAATVDTSSPKHYKAKGPASAAKSAGEMLGIEKPSVSVKRETAIDTTYSIKDKNGNEVGIYTEMRAGKDGKLILYKYKKSAKKG